MRTAMLARKGVLQVHLLVLMVFLSVTNVGYGEEQRHVLKKIDISRGIYVILGDTTGSLTSRLAGDTELY